MPKNRIIYAGVLIIAASALLWLGATLLEKIKDFMIYFGVFGAALLVIGVLLETKKKSQEPESTSPSETNTAP